MNGANQKKMNEVIREIRKVSTNVQTVQRQISDLRALLTSQTRITCDQVKVLMEMPSHLIRTYFTVETLGIARASDVAACTRKARANEASNLNQLTRQGFLIKERKPVSGKSGRQALFRPTKPMLILPQPQKVDA